MIKNRRKITKYLLFVLFLTMLFLSVFTKKVKAVATGLLEDVATELTSQLVEVDLNPNDASRYTYNQNIQNIPYDERTQLEVGKEYAWRVKNAFKAWVPTGDDQYEYVSFDVRISVTPTSIGAGTNTMSLVKVSSNHMMRFYSRNSEATVKYELLRNDQLASTASFSNYVFGFLDPDGADYIFNDPLSAISLYYLPADVYSTGNTNYTFGNAFRVRAVNGKYGIYIEHDNLNFDNGLIAIAKAGNSYTMTWSTTRLGVEDMLVLPALYYKPETVKIRVHINGGYMHTNHGSAYGTSGNYVTVNSSTTIHTLSYGEPLSSNGLINYNNANAVNLGRLGYYVKSGEEYNTAADGSGATFDQVTAYRGVDFADYADSNGVVTLYVNWKKSDYNINYTTNGGTNNSSNPSTYTVTDSVITINQPTRPGYTFSGWRKTVSNMSWRKGFLNYETGEYEISTQYPDSYYSGCISLKKGITYTLSGYGDYNTSYIRWRLYNGSTYLGSASGTSYTATEDITDYKARIVFFDSSDASQRSGVKVTASADDKSVKIHMGSTGNITLVANWEEITATLTYNANGHGTAPASVTMKYTTQTNASTGITATGYNFTGWNTAADGSGTAIAAGAIVNPANEVPTALTLYAQWSAYQVKIRILPNKGTLSRYHGSAVSTVRENDVIYVTRNGDKNIHTIDYGGSLNSNGLANYDNPSALNLERLGYKVVSPSIYINSSNNQIYNQTTAYLASDFADCSTGDKVVNLMVNWVAKVYEVTYDTNGADDIPQNPNQYTIDSPVTDIISPTKEGYKFIGWSRTVDTLDWKTGYLNETTGEEEMDSIYEDSYYSGYVSVSRGTTYTISGYGSYDPDDIIWRVYYVSGGDLYYYGTASGNTFTPTNTDHRTYKVRILLPETNTEVQRESIVVSGGVEDLTKINNGCTGNIHLVANWEANTATVKVKKNDASWIDNGINVALYQNNAPVYQYNTATTNNEDITWSVVNPGTYNVYASKDAINLTDLEDTGVTITISHIGTATIDYYTLTLQNGIGISAVTGGGTFLKGQTANIDATVANGYTWEGWSVISGDTPD